MTDILIVVAVLAYAAVGYLTGLVRRVLGLLAIYFGYFVATSVDPTIANVVLQAVPWSVSDALIAGYFAALVAIVLVVEVMATFYRKQLQVAAVVLDRQSGLLVGAVVAIFSVTVALSLLAGAAAPTQGAPDGAQIQIGDAIRNSPLAQAMLRTVGRPASLIFAPVTPSEPGAYFSGQEARKQH